MILCNDKLRELRKNTLLVSGQPIANKGNINYNKKRLMVCRGNHELFAQMYLEDKLDAWQWSAKMCRYISLSGAFASALSI